MPILHTRILTPIHSQSPIANVAYASVLPKGGDWTSESCNTEGLALNVAYGVQSTHSAAYGDEVELSGNVSYTATASGSGNDVTDKEMSYAYVTRVTSTGRCT